MAKDTRETRRTDLLMTAEEATRIIEKYEDGSLDTSLPGTLDLVHDAQRNQLERYMWGTARHDPRRRIQRRAISIGCACVAITIFGMWLLFFLTP